MKYKMFGYDEVKVCKQMKINNRDGKSFHFLTRDI